MVDLAIEKNVSAIFEMFELLQFPGTIITLFSHDVKAFLRKVGPKAN